MASSLAVLAAGLVAAPAAQAIGFTNLSAAPASTQAGANSDVNIHMEFTSAGDQVRNLTIGLPPGMIGDPNATPKCTVAQLNADTCPANTIVGEVSAVANILGLPLPVTATGSLYNLDPQPGEPARFGIVLHPLGIGLVPPIILQSAVQLRPTDFGLNTVINEIPNTTLLPGDTTIVSQDITLYGTAPGTGRAFMRNPTSCSVKTTAFSATSYSGSTTTDPATGQASFTPTGCGSLPFSPSFSARVRAERFPKGQVAAVTTAIDQDAGEAGLLRADVTLPPEISADASLLQRACDLATFQAHACPSTATIGSAVATSPLLNSALSGPVLLVFGVPGSTLPGIGLDLRGELPLQLTGTFALDGTSTFDNLPDIPISHFELRFSGGADGLLLTSRNICLPPAPVFRTNFTAHSGATRAGSADGIVEPCNEPAPTLTAMLRGARSGQPKMRLRVETKAARIDAVTFTLPKGLRLAKGAALDRNLNARTDSEAISDEDVKTKGRKLIFRTGFGAFERLRVRLAAGSLLSRGRGRRMGMVGPSRRDADGVATTLRSRAKR
jgi:hypothetical protein